MKKVYKYPLEFGPSGVVSLRLPGGRSGSYGMTNGPQFLKAGIDRARLSSLEKFPFSIWCLVDPEIKAFQLYSFELVVTGQGPQDPEMEHLETVFADEYVCHIFYKKGVAHIG